MFLKQGNYQETYVCQKNLDFKICKKIVKSRFSESFLSVIQSLKTVHRLLSKVNQKLKMS